MSNAKKKLMIRVITKRMAAGETFEEIMTDYPKLSETEIDELKSAVEVTE